ncbi:PD-(D/E)XK nuclease family protein [Halosimplex halobium]|uniref:PD-(D/E)XK nuclease family protein n=1 Tax=Halosimplex halobium TaxID=3396618 RepID=UPI003F57A0F3
MSLATAKSIDDLAAEVADADVTISADAPLTLALDRRATEPRIGRMAATPRSQATGEFAPDDRRDLFAEFVSGTDLSWKTATRALELTLDCWDRTGERDGICNYPGFDTPPIRAAVDLLESTPNSHRTLAETTLDPGREIAVIDEGSLSALDRRLLPDDDAAYRSVDPFAAGTTPLPPTHLYPSATAVVEAVCEHIDPATADHVGVVLDEGTIYSSLLEAKLEAANVPYQGGPVFVDDDEVRLFLRLLQTSFAGDGLTVGEVRPLLVAAGLDVSREYDDRRVATVDRGDDEVWSRIERFRRAVQEGTFADALDAFEDLVGTRRDQLRTELRSLGRLDASVTEPAVNELVYYLQSFEVPVDRESEGVLLVDAGATATVDREIVFYLGLGEGWARTPPEYPWVDAEAFVDRDFRRFQRLLQNGDQRFVLAQATMAGDEVTPCPYLRELFDDRTVDGFDDLPDVTDHTGQARDDSRDRRCFEAPTDAAEPEPDPVETVSQSTLKQLVNAPREYYFDELLASPTNLAMERGQALHDAAEVYVNAPAVVREERERVLDAMCDRLAPFVTEPRLRTLRTRLDVGLDVLVAYLDGCPSPPADGAFTTYDDPAHDNDLAETLDVALDAHHCERWFTATDLGLHGVVDFLQDEGTLVDYKSGSVRDASTVQRKAALDPVHDRPDFQAKAYLAQHRRERPGKRLELRFVHVLGAVDEMVKGADPDLDELVTTITYVPSTFAEFVASRAMFDQVTDYADSNDRCKVLDTLGYEQYRTFFEAHELPREGDDPERRAAIRESFAALAESEVGSYKYVANGVDKIFDDLTEPTGYFLEDDLDAFESFVDERIAELEGYHDDRFPVAFDDDGPNWDRVDHRDLILTGGTTDA